MKPRFAIGLAAVGLLVLIVLARTWADTPDAAPVVLRAQKIELVDEKGRVRARLNTESDGTTVFRIIGKNGEVRVKLAGSDEGSGMVLMDETTEPGVHLLANPRTKGGTYVKVIRGEHERTLEP